MVITLNVCFFYPSVPFRKIIKSPKKTAYESNNHIEQMVESKSELKLAHRLEVRNSTTFKVSVWCLQFISTALKWAKCWNDYYVLYLSFYLICVCN